MDDYIWRFALDGEPAGRKAPENLFTETDFCTIPMPDGSRQSSCTTPPPTGYRDLPLGTVDASVVALAERLGLDIIATLDRRHFTVVRPKHVRAFEILP